MKRIWAKILASRRAASASAAAERHILFVLFCAIIILGVMAAFYRSPFRDKVEDLLFDVRARFAPASQVATPVMTVEIDEDDITTLRGPGPADINYDALITITQEILEHQPRAILVNLYPQIFPYGDKGLAQFVDRFSQATVFFGVFGISEFSAGSASLPAPLQTIADRVFLGDPLPEFRRAVLRTLPLGSNSETTNPRLMLPFLAGQFLWDHPDEAADMVRDAVVLRQRDELKYHYLRLNYQNPDRVPNLNARQLANLPRSSESPLKDRIIIVGYRAWRPWGTQTSRVNTPWQADGDELSNGVPFTRVQAMAVENVINGRWLTTTPTWVNILQSLIIAALSLLIWRLRSGYAAMAFPVMWTALIAAHGWIFSRFSAFVPLADTAMYSSLALIAGSFWRLRLEGHIRAVEEARAESKRQVANLQGQYLNDLAKQLSRINSSILGQIRPIRSSTNEEVQKIYGQALSSGEELREYLGGIEQLAELDARSLRRVVRRPTAIRPIIDRIMKRFDFRLRDESIELRVDCSSDLFAMADELLLEQVLYNLISNAVKYSPKTNAKIEVTARCENSFCIIDVKDEGPGIAEEFREKIFEKFYRIKDERLYQTKGHGLGLFLSRYFASSIAATVTLRENTSGQRGSTFRISLKGAR